MLEFIQSVYLLTLKGKDVPTLKKKYSDTFGDDRLHILEAEGTPKNSNSGNLTTGFFKILRHDAVDDTALDITRNHLHMIKEMYTKGVATCLFLEDDAEFEEFPIHAQISVRDWMKRSHWDIFYLGYCPWPILFSLLTTRRIVRVYTPLTTHAYILSRSGMEKVLEYTKKNGTHTLHIDKLFSKIPSFRRFALFPMVSFQNQDPALYTKACDYLGVRFSFKTLSRILERVSVLIPFLLIFCICFLCWRLLPTHGK